MSDRPRPAPELLQRYADEFNQSATLRHFGVKMSFPTPDRVRAEIDPIRPEQLGGLGADAVNGGILAAVFDLVIGSTPALIDPTRRTATMQLSMSFMHAVRGKKLWAEAWIDRAGSTSLFATAELYDEHGLACARCQGVVKLSKAHWASGASPATN